jgi:hypothetical protein
MAIVVSNPGIIIISSSIALEAVCPVVWRLNVLVGRENMVV